jgi:hypothetical protein
VFRHAKILAPTSHTVLRRPAPGVAAARGQEWARVHVPPSLKKIKNPKTPAGNLAPGSSTTFWTDCSNVTVSARARRRSAVPASAPSAWPDSTPGDGEIEVVARAPVPDGRAARVSRGCR